VPLVRVRTMSDDHHDRSPRPGSTPEGGDADAELVRRAQAGDREAFDAIFRKHREPVERVIRVRVRDEALTDELVQRTFVRAYEGLASFRSEAALSTWLYTIACNVVRNHARDSPSSRAIPLDDVELITNVFATGKLVAREVRQKLAGALAELGAKQQMIVELHLLHGMPFREVARMVDSTEESARRNYGHAVKKLRAILLPDDEPST
jgi:RNA polymerase sigma-70 factor, ECF subfamily